MRIKKLIYTVACMLFVLGALPSRTYAATREDIEQFPESYRAGLYALSEAHPNWKFECYNTGLDWNTVIKNEMQGARSLIGSYKGTNWYTEIYGQNWAYASKSAVEYTMDPRNFFTEEYIFQFECLAYNGVCHTVEATQCILDSTFMSGILPGTRNTYAHTFVEIGREINVSSFHLASRVYQEQGLGNSNMISGTYPGYEGYYNYYNVGASGSSDKEVLESGLSRARKEGWTTPYLSIRGGANFISKSYILRGQDTLYFQKFDVERSDNSIYSHQYMQNIEAPMSESRKTYQAYARYNLLEQAFVFRIPVYYNMPQTPCLSPDELSEDIEEAPEDIEEAPEYIEELSGVAGCFKSFNGADYWYEYGYLQGYRANDPNYRGKEIYDPESGHWYWLDNVQRGAKTVSKDVYQESSAGRFAENIVRLPDGSIDLDASTGKWVRYNESGHMVKGWDGAYYFDEYYGTMAKGYCTIMDENGTYIEYYFNTDTGVLERVIGEVPEYGWLTVDGISYWYENHIRQGYRLNEPDYRGKEIYDAASDAWYWLDNVQDGAKTVNKDVYQESLAGDWGEMIRTEADGTQVRYGKWVRYDENGHMVKGWDTDSDGNTYFFDLVYGTMAKGNVWIDGTEYYFDPITGVLQ